MLATQKRIRARDGQPDIDFRFSGLPPRAGSPRVRHRDGDTPAFRGAAPNDCGGRGIGKRGLEEGRGRERAERITALSERVGIPTLLEERRGRERMKRRPTLQVIFQKCSVGRGSRTRAGCYEAVAQVVVQVYFSVQVIPLHRVGQCCWKRVGDGERVASPRVKFFPKCLAPWQRGRGRGAGRFSERRSRGAAGRRQRESR